MLNISVDTVRAELIYDFIIFFFQNHRVWGCVHGMNVSFMKMVNIV